MKVVAEH